MIIKPQKCSPALFLTGLEVRQVPKNVGPERPAMKRQELDGLIYYLCGESDEASPARRGHTHTDHHPIDKCLGMMAAFACE